jgi:hypothetical protein
VDAFGDISNHMAELDAETLDLREEAKYLRALYCDQTQ